MQGSWTVKARRVQCAGIEAVAQLRITRRCLKPDEDAPFSVRSDTSYSEPWTQRFIAGGSSSESVRFKQTTITHVLKRYTFIDLSALF